AAGPQHPETVWHSRQNSARPSPVDGLGEFDGAMSATLPAPSPSPFTGDAGRVVRVGVGALSVDEVVAVARYGARVELAADAVEAMAASRSIIEALANDPAPHYGVSTGFGALATKHIPLEQRQQLQRSLVRSHAASSGLEVEREAVRGTMLLRPPTMATGRTGVRPLVAQAYADVLNAGITPIIGEYGSLGCSGDLAPLAHCALAVMGEGAVRDADGTAMDGASALTVAGLTPVVLQ